MRKYLINIYRILGFIINPFLFFTKLFSLVFIDATLIDYIVALFLAWTSITWIYFIQKTKSINKLSDTNEINIESINGNYIQRFKLDSLIVITNISFSIILIIYSIYMLITDPIQQLKDGELFRMIFILFVLIYSILQIQYSNLIFRIRLKK